MLPRRASTSEVWSHGAPRIERLGVRVAFPLLALLVRRDLRLRMDTIPEQRAIMEAFFERIEARLDDGRGYLLGDRLTAADLALAALAAPAVLPREYGGPMPTLDDLPRTMHADVERIRSRGTGQFVLRLYREERGRKVTDDLLGTQARR
jgi:glutathione S-transferase